MGDFACVMTQAVLAMVVFDTPEGCVGILMVGEKRWWVFFLNDKNRIQYNDQCKKCVYECKQSFQCRIVWCGKYYSKRRKR